MIRSQPITAADYAKAALMDRERRGLESIGLRLVNAIGYQMRAGVGNAIRWGHNPSEVMARGFREFHAPIVDAMIAAHLRGMLRVQLEVRPVIRKLNLAIGSYAGAIELMQRRLSLTDDELDKIGRVYSDEATRVLTRAQAFAERPIQQAALEIVRRGLTVRPGIEFMRLAFDSAGLSPANDNLIETLVRTQVGQAYSAGQANGDESPVVQEILWGYTHCTNKDDRVCTICGPREGITLPKDDPYWQTNHPILHHNCRCMLLRRMRDFIGQDAIPDGFRIVNPPAGLLPPAKGFGINPARIFPVPAAA